MVLGQELMPALRLVVGTFLPQGHLSYWFGGAPILEFGYRGGWPLRPGEQRAFPRRPVPMKVLELAYISQLLISFEPSSYNFGELLNAQVLVSTSWAAYILKRCVKVNKAG